MSSRLLPALALLGVLLTLAVEAVPAMRFNGWGFFTKSIWSEGGGYNAVIVTTDGVKHLAGAAFGVLPEIVGTVLTSVFALIIAVPVSDRGGAGHRGAATQRLASVVGMFLDCWPASPAW